jgi:hypothetical protein
MFVVMGGLAACAGPTGPVIGDWRREVPQSATEQLVELVLDGTPDAPSGRYHVTMTTESGGVGRSSGTQWQDGDWHREQAQDGRQVFHLLNDLPGSIDRYELGADDALYPMGKGNYPDTSPMARLYTLLPVPHGGGYGRA